MSVHRPVLKSLILSLGLLTLAPAQDAPHRGRKYKVPPATSHIEVMVLRGYNGKPIANAAVVFHSVREGKDEGNLEVKTNEDGRAIIDVIPTGSSVDVQVIAPGFATFAEQYLVAENERTIEIKMIRPRAQISTYQDNMGKDATVKPGTQEPGHPHSDPVIQAPQPTNHTSDPNPLSPVTGTPGSTQNPTPKPQ
jgi:hypothetical protein